MIHGIHIKAVFEAGVSFDDEWLETVYRSVQANMAIVSADMFVDEDASSIAFHLGIDGRLGTSEECVDDVAHDALDKAFDDANGGVIIEDRPQVISGAVAVFA